jgi:hypothetical protein
MSFVVEMRGVIRSSVYRRSVSLASPLPYNSWWQHKRRFTSTNDSSLGNQKSPPPGLADIQKYYQVHRRGQEGHGSREYLLLPPGVELPQVIEDPSLPVAALFAHRNMIFGARAFYGYTKSELCSPLVEVAIREAEVYGDQPQAMATLKGLSDWVAKSIQKMQNDAEATPQQSTSQVMTGPYSKTLIQLQTTDPAAMEAVCAIATGIPRPGHSMVGQGTYRDGENAWKTLAEEFIELGLSDEANLYQKFGGRLVTIEHLADKNPHYLKSAGGAMARFFIL